VPTILSGRVAQLGISSRNAMQIEVDRFNASGGLDGRPIELIVATAAAPGRGRAPGREMITSDGCEFLLDGEPSSAASPCTRWCARPAR
jgi:branched-chain amino acid transport system substrate-binding protein